MDPRYDTIENNYLTVSIEKPGVVYKGTRFDWTGHVSKLMYLDKYHFCQPESVVKGLGSGGSGLCNEFGIHQPVGYQDIKVGDVFPKIGVGSLLKETTEPYFYMHAYPVKPFQIEVSSSHDRIRYRMQGATPSGYAFQLEKQVLLHENNLIFDLKLTNTGNKMIDTNEYSHNFIAIDENPIGPDYTLEIPVAANLSSCAHLFHQTGSSLSILKSVQEEFYFQGIIPIQPLCDAKWTLKNTNSGVSISEQLDAPLSAFAVWGKRHVISPEMFVKIMVMPGQTQQWKRKYTFSELN